MTARIQIIFIIFLILALGVIVYMVKKRQMELKYVLVWMGGDIALIIITCFPNLMGKMADFLGIYTPVNMIFFLGFIFLTMILFSLTVILSRVTEKVRRLAQIISMLPDDIKKQFFEEENGNIDITEK